MFREKVAKLTKVMFTGLTMALCVTAFNPAVAVKADILQESEPNNNPGMANQLPLNTWMEGKIDKRSDEDWYKFTIEQPGETYFELGADASNASSSAKWGITLYDEDKHPLFNDNVHYEKLNKTGWMPGIYYVKISSYHHQAYGKSGAYNLIIHNTPSDQWEKEQYYTKKNLSNANIVSLNKQYTGKLYCKEDVDYYRFKLKGTNGVSFRFTIDDAVANPGKWRIEFIDNEKSLGYRHITSNETVTVPRCCGDLIVKVSNPASCTTATGAIYHIQATGKLGATEFTSLKGGTAKASLRWKKVTNATGYYIYRSTSRDSGYKKVATVTGKTSYTDKKSLKNGGYYYYKIVAFRKSGSKIIKSAATASNSTYIYKK